MLAEGWSLKTISPLGPGSMGGPPFWILMHFERDEPSRVDAVAEQQRR